MAAGGRHTLALALPDNSGSSDRSDTVSEASRRAAPQIPSLSSSRGASPQESEDQESSLGDHYDDDVILGRPGRPSSIQGRHLPSTRESCSAEHPHARAASCAIAYI